jgi:ribosomal protein L7Ae-like RNA K-turn-binding protein
MENNKVNGSEQEMLEMVIKELIEEHAKTNRVIADLVTGINSINKKIDKSKVNDR